MLTKLSTILVILSINVVFNSVGWATFDPVGTTEYTIFGLRSLMFRNEEINIKGFFTLKLSPYYKKKVEKEGKDIKIRKRKVRYHEYKDKRK